MRKHTYFTIFFFTKTFCSLLQNGEDAKKNFSNKNHFIFTFYDIVRKKINIVDV